MNAAACAVCASMLFYSLPAAGAQWQMLADGSHLQFTATYEGQRAPGVFSDFETRMQFDPDDPGNGALNVTVSMGSADMNSADVNEAIHGRQWLDVERYPVARFESDAIVNKGDDQYMARGVLRLKGVRRPLEVPFTWVGSGETAIMSGELTMRRTRFEIGTGEWAQDEPIGLDVHVRFEVRLRKER